MKFVRSQDLIATELDDDTVMMSIETGAYYGLSGSGTLIWELLEVPRTKAEVIAALQERYDVSLDALQADVEAFIDDMLKNALIVMV